SRDDIHSPDGTSARERISGGRGQLGGEPPRGIRVGQPTRPPARDVAGRAVDDAQDETNAVVAPLGAGAAQVKQDVSVAPAPPERGVPQWPSLAHRRGRPALALAEGGRDRRGAGPLFQPVGQGKVAKRGVANSPEESSKPIVGPARLFD